jgi:hypothetical protein
MGEYALKRKFWLYFIVILFFIIIGMTLISTYNFLIFLLWIVPMISLLFIIYYLDDESKTLGRSILVNTLFILILILNIFWISEYINGNEFNKYIGVIIAIMFLFFITLARNPLTIILIFISIITWILLIILS